MTTASAMSATPRATATDPCAEQQRISEMRDLVGFAASGGGYRAALFHVGSLWRLNELGWLSKVDRFSGVSGGSITLGALASAWSRLTFVDGRATNFADVVAAPLIDFTQRRIDVWAALYGLVPGRSPATVLEREYRDLMGERTLQDLPDHPQFVFNATSLQTGVTMRFTKRYLRDYRAGCIPFPELPLTAAVAASSAFPPFLSPNVVRLPGRGLRPTSDAALRDEGFHTRLVLTDGGVYDNLGLQTLNSFRTVLASDGGSPGKVDVAPLPPLQMLRVMSIMTEQTRALRRAALVHDLEEGRRKGAIWTIKTDITHFSPRTGAPLLPVHPTQIASLASVPTRLWPIGRGTAARVVNWGYAIADASLRAFLHLDGDAPSWPFPKHALDGATGTRVTAVAGEGIA